MAVIPLPRVAQDDVRVGLEPLRTELGQIDRDILGLVARRQAVAQRIGAVKREAGIIQVNRPGYQPAHVDREIRAVGRNDSCDCHQKKGDNALDAQPLRPCGF